MSLLRAPAATGRRGAELTRPAGAEVTAGIIGAEAAATAAAAATVEHGQRGVEALQHDFGRVLLDAALVGPFAGLQRALNVNLRALLQILLDNLAKRFGEDDDAMPLRLFLALAGVLVAPGVRRGDAQIGDRPSVLCPPDFRILAEVADQNHLVHATRHRRSPLIITGKITGPAAFAGRLHFLTCRLIRACARFRTSGTTLYARRRRRLSAPCGYPHIASTPPMFQLCSSSKHEQPAPPLLREQWNPNGTRQVSPQSQLW